MPAKKQRELDADSLRMRHLWRALNFRSSAEFADHLDIDRQRWNNFENGLPLSKEVAFIIVRKVPGMTLDWLYFGDPRGLPFELAMRLAAPEAGKSARASGRRSGS